MRPYAYICRVCNQPIKREDALHCAILDSLLAASEYCASNNYDFEKDRPAVNIFRRAAAEFFWRAYQFTAIKIFA